MIASTQQEHYSLWVDGSAFSPGRFQTRAGAGWVLRNDTTGEPLHRRYRPLSDLHTGSTLVAEFYAAAYALHSIPKGAAVRLQTDCLAVRNFLRDGRLPPMNSSSDKTRSGVQDAAALLWQVQQNLSLDPMVDKKTDEDHRFLRRAHHLARTAAKLG